MVRLRFVAALLAVGLLSSSFLVGQDKKGDSKEPLYITKRLPPSYNKLGLTDKQKKDIYRIHARYAAKIDELQQQIATLREQEKTETENVLTPAQKARLKELRPGGATGGTGAKEKQAKEKISGSVKEIKKP